MVQVSRGSYAPSFAIGPSDEDVISPIAQHESLEVFGSHHSYVSLTTLAPFTGASRDLGIATSRFLGYSLYQSFFMSEPTS